MIHNAPIIHVKINHNDDSAICSVNVTFIDHIEATYDEDADINDVFQRASEQLRSYNTQGTS